MSTTLGSAYVQIIPSARGIKGSIAGLLNGEAGAAGEVAGSEMGGRMVGKLGKLVAAAGIGAMLGQAVITGFKKAIEEGAALEQSIGGIKTLFGTNEMSLKEYAEQAGKSIGEVRAEYAMLKEAEDLALGNAAQAYKTAGLSANDYMQSITGFAAALKASGLSEKEAAEAGNRAVIAMADNANKMGSSMEDIQNAYQGFAKQNYTMLDNLKLGYGGTKGEMERLLADAEKLSGTHYDISNLADVYAAIEVIQTELGITGTTAREGAETFSGSLASMRAAADNFAASLMLGENVEQSLAALAESVGNFVFKNFLPAIGRILASLPKVMYTAIVNGLPALREAAGKMINELTGGGNGFDLGEKLGQLLIDNLPKILNALGRIYLAVMEFLVEAAIGLLQVLGGLLAKLFKTLGSAIAKRAKAAAKSMVDGLKGPFKTIASFFSGIVQKIKSYLGFNGLAGKVRGVFNKVKEALTNPIETAKSLIQRAINTIRNLFPLSIGRIFSNLKLPHISVSGGKAPFGIAGKGSLPKFSVSWYAKAQDNPYLFSSPTFFGAGERGDEMLYGRAALMRDIAAAAGGGKSVNATYNITVSGSTDPAEFADKLVRSLKMQMRTA